MNRQRRRIGQLATLEQASKDYGIEAEEISAAVGAKGVKPRMIINGEPYFDLADLSETAALLRAAPAPPHEGLLRAAESVAPAEKTLVRPMDGPIPEFDIQMGEEDVPATLQQGVDNA
jgi:hypothetical protein